ncbi:MAG: segregation and condensation protein B [Acidimicrobiales bacterium]|nr:MAG: segregation and condensation protein B [Acidimicrobiales bacterium]
MTVQEGHEHEIRRAAEAILVVATEPVAGRVIAQALEIPVVRAEAILEELAAEYRRQRRGFRLVKVAGGWRLESDPDLDDVVRGFLAAGRTTRLSQAALETLAIIAYKQPISRAQISAIRGVTADGVVRTLEQRGYVREVARDTGPGGAALLGTTELFLEHLGIESLEQLPPLGAFVPDAETAERLERSLRAGGD